MVAEAAPLSKRMPPSVPTAMELMLNEPPSVSVPPVRRIVFAEPAAVVMVLLLTR